jgi:hypothetical protein
MKKVNLFCLSLLLMATAVLTGCEKDGPSEDSAIQVESGSALTQSVFADETQGNGGVTFTTTGAWTSSITETTAPVKSLSLKSAQDASWISISPSSGDRAGSYTVTITLEPNLTGADRTAVITITCGDSEITITVTQKATKEDGTAPGQQQIIDLLKNAWGNTKSSPEIAISATNTALPYPMVVETNQVQKKSLFAAMNGAVFSEFEYIDNLTRYVYENGTKYREELPSDFWNDYGNVNDMFREGGFVPEDYTWTVSSNVYAGVSLEGTYLNEVTLELTADSKVKTLHVVDADDGVVDDDITMTFSYGSVNPVFPAGFDQADFPLKGSGQYGGTGTFTNTMADQPLTVDGAKYNGQIRFYKEDADVADAIYLDMYFPGKGADVSRLPAGTYPFVDRGQSMPEYYFYCQKGVIGGVAYYGKGGTVTVSMEGDIYTVAVDMDTYHGDYGSPVTGKIRGTYTGYLPAGQG